MHTHQSLYCCCALHTHRVISAFFQNCFLASKWFVLLILFVRLLIPSMQAHLGNCDYRDVLCTQCGQYIQQLDMEAHQKELCAMRPTCTRVVELEHSIDRALSSCLDQELRMTLLTWGTYHGILLWKIDEFDRRRREAVDGVTLSLYSTPFYTSPNGYKMCTRVYLNGDGMGKGSHLSFSFFIMRGPFDALLQWPFKQKVTLSLINQNGKKHISDSFRLDPHSSSFQKPGQREMNIASGCPMFIRIDHLFNGGFVKDDAIYVRVVVETMDLPDIIP